MGTGVVTCVAAWLYVPEPSQRNSAELDEMFEKGVPAWRMRKFVTDVQKMHSASTAQRADEKIVD